MQKVQPYCKKNVLFYIKKDCFFFYPQHKKVIQTGFFYWHKKVCDTTWNFPSSKTKIWTGLTFPTVKKVTTLTFCHHHKTNCTAGNSLIGFLIESLGFFLRKNERMSDSLKKMSDLLIRSFLVSEMSNLLTLLISSEQPEQIAHGRSFFVSNLRDLLTSLIFGERLERFAHIAHQKRGNEQITHFYKNLYKTY